jgi:hypothetical protein
MSFNGSWAYSLPATWNPVVGGTRITIAWANGTLTDIGSALSALGALVEPGQTLGTKIGYLDVPKNAPGAGAYTLVLSDRGKFVHKTDSAAVTVPPNSSVAFPVGSVVSIFNFGASSMTLTEGAGVDLYLPGSATPGNRTITGYTMATILKFDTDSWLVQGSGVA